MALLALKVADPWVKATSDIFISAVKRLIASKIKVFVHIICMCTVYIYYVYL